MVPEVRTYTRQEWKKRTQSDGVRGREDPRSEKENVYQKVLRCPVNVYTEDDGDSRREKSRGVRVVSRTVYPLCMPKQPS